MLKHILKMTLIALGLVSSVSAFAQSSDQMVWVINTFTMNEGENPETVANLQLELVQNVKMKWSGFISQQTLISQDKKTVSTIEVYNNFDTLKAIASNETLVEYRHKIQQYAQMNPVVYQLVGSSTKEQK
ncbi:hypothetical protein F9B74_01685 [Pelistega sp. NLN82]|uniref:Antibiotic biosynthesis monooxygenase n=1 Tax=Pelistega ratti TaxID=2652177 RepID=A0A6L9Y4Y8_9BURK|nr:hypothetical protein [Pelistega ratti]NEN75037.1 hypothetical protein [Pelistega ratti]